MKLVPNRISRILEAVATFSRGPRSAVCAVLALTAVACTDAPTSPSAPNDVHMSPVPALAKYPPNAPTGAPCGFSTDNPYPCCQNSATNYGNCTGGAWQLAKENGWGKAVPGQPGSSWGDASSWATVARKLGYIVESTPSLYAIAVGDTHVATVTSWTSKKVTTKDQACGYGARDRFYTTERDIKWFTQGFIRAPIPEAKLLLWSGASSMTGSGEFTARRVNGSVTVNFGFGLLRSNVASGSSTFSWKVAGTAASTSGTFEKKFTSAGTYSISATVTNKLGVSTVATATLVVR